MSDERTETEVSYGQGGDGAGVLLSVSGSSRSSLWTDRLWRIGITMVLYVLLFRVELSRLLDLWLTAKDSHGLLIPFFSLYFIYQDRRRLEVDGKPSYLGLLVMLLSLAGYLYSLILSMYYPRQVMMVVMIAGIVLFQGGWRIFRVAWLPVFYLLFAMPLPQRLYIAITMPMREWASMVAAMILNILPGVDCTASNVVIHGVHLGEPFNLNVADACSGMRLLMTFVALGVAMAYLEYRPLLHRIVLLCSTIPIAIFCNMLRVLITGLIHVYVGEQYATGTLHTMLGLVMLGIAFGLYGLLAWIMNRLFVDEKKEEEGILVVNPKEGAGR